MPELLDVKDLEAWYGESHVLFGVAFSIKAGEVVTIAGRNGAGKTTTLKCIQGMIPKRKGSIKLNGEELIGMASHKIARRGIELCPEERGIFATLDVFENLMLP